MPAFLPTCPLLMAIAPHCRNTIWRATRASVTLPLFWCVIMLSLLRFTPGQADKLFPCAFADTVNITDRYHSAANDSAYIYDDVTIPQHLVAEYEFIIWQNKRRPVAKHLRACICQLKTCIHLCCPAAHFYDLRTGMCQPASLVMDNNASANLFEDNLFRMMHHEHAANDSMDDAAAFRKQYALQTGTLCEHMRFVTKSKQAPLSLLLNGTISGKTHHTVSRRHYCWTPFGIEGGTWAWQQLVCAGEKLRFALGMLEWTYAISLMITIISFIVTLIAYTWCNQLRKSFYGFAIQLYALCVIVGYSLLTHLVLTEPRRMSQGVCVCLARYTLIFLLLSFFILSLISLNFYLRFHGILLSRWNCCLSVLPLISLAVGWSYYVSSRSLGGSDPIWGKDVCWFDPRDWSIMTYFYVPVLISFALSGFLYIITLVQLYEQQEAQLKKLRLLMECNRFKSFWQYSAYNFVAWLALIIVFVLNYYSYERSHISYAACFFASLQGFGALHSLVGKNEQIKDWLRGIDRDVEEQEMNKSVEERDEEVDIEEAYALSIAMK